MAHLFGILKQHVDGQLDVVLAFVQNQTDLILVALSHLNHLLHLLLDQRVV